MSMVRMTRLHRSISGMKVLVAEPSAGWLPKFGERFDENDSPSSEEEDGETVNPPHPRIDD
jgi:hypothetical protein